MIEFERSTVRACFQLSSGDRAERFIEIRRDPLTRRTSRITPSRALEKERGTERLHTPPREDLDPKRCPFCPQNINTMTPVLLPEISDAPRLRCNRSVLFPNLFPYTEWSAVSIFDDTHYVEIGQAEVSSYRDSFINCAAYLSRVNGVDPEAIFMSITQNHLPGAGGSLVHPHLQVHASRFLSNSHRLLSERTEEYRKRHGRCLLSDLVSAEKKTGERYIGQTGIWEWTAAFAPTGFYEIWGIAPGHSSLLTPDHSKFWEDLARGVLNIQRFYRSLNRNCYNLALISIENKAENPGLKVSITARSSYAPWVRSDFTGFDIASREMATFTPPETTANAARAFWSL